MNDDVKEVLNEMMSFIELLHTKVKIMDDLKDRALDKFPDVFPPERIAVWESGNEKIAQIDISKLKDKIKSL